MKQNNKTAAFRRSVLSAAVAGAILASTGALANTAPLTIHGVVAGSHFTAPVNSDNPSTATASSTTAAVYQNAKVCFDANNNAACDTGEVFTHTNSTGAFLLTGAAGVPLAAEIGTASTNNGNAVAARVNFRVHKDQIAALTVNPLMPVNVAVTPLTTEIVRSIENDGYTYAQATQALAERLLGQTAGASNTALVIGNPAAISNSGYQEAVLKESNILTSRFTLAAKFVDRQDPDLTAAELGANPNATAAPMTMPQAQEAAMNLEGIPRYDHIFIIMLENKATSSISGSPWAPNINSYMTGGNIFTSYFATGNPSEPNYTALGGADDWGITDDSQWNCNATGATAVQDLVVPSSAAPGLANSPFTATCTIANAASHNVVGRGNIFNALTANGLSWRTYSESMNPGQDFRIDSIADSSISAPDHVYNGTLPVVSGSTLVSSTGGSAGDGNLTLPLPAQLYRTKHHPGMAYQNVRSAAEFGESNRTLGGGQWDAVLTQSSKYSVPSGYNVDQFGTDLASGDLGNINFLIPDQCDDMHGITVKGTDSVTKQTVSASDCSSVSNNVNGVTGGPIIKRGDNYVGNLIAKIQASPVWTNPNKRSAIVIMYDEGNATSGYNSCCGWNPGNQTVATPVIENSNGSFANDSSLAYYYVGNRGHGESVFIVLNNHMASSAAQGAGTAPYGVYDSDYYSHFSFVRTMQDMFGLADPDNDGSYMNRSKYTQSFISEYSSLVPELAGSADPHFDSVRPMNHAYVIPAGYTEKQSTDVNSAPQTGPDATQTNLWSLK